MKKPPPLPAWIINLLPVPTGRNYVARFQSNEKNLSKIENVRQLLVDVSVIYQADARTGIQRVVRALLLQLINNPPAGFRICPVYASRHKSYCYADLNFLHSSRKTSTEEYKYVTVKSGDVFLALDLAAHLIPFHQQKIIKWKRAGVKIHVLVYDLLPVLHPNWFNPKTVKNFHRWIRWISVYADSAICISETVKSELLTWLKSRFSLSPYALPCSTIALGGDIDATAPSSGLPSNAEQLLTHLGNTIAVLMVGTVEPRKGYDQALSAFEQLWQKSGSMPSLVIVGKSGWKTDSLQKKITNHPELGKRLFWVESASDEYLNKIYAACAGVLVASRGEGFGLPLIEAIRHKKPVMARDIPVFREIRTGPINYFTGDSPCDLAEPLHRWISKPQKTEESIVENEILTWQNSAKQLLFCLGLKSSPTSLGDDSNIH